MSTERIISDTNFDQDFKEIKRLRDIWNIELGQASENRLLSYDPVLERYQWQKIATEQDEIAFRYYEGLQIKTALGERLHTSKSVITFTTLEGEVYGELLSNEPFETVLERGIEYRKSKGSKETEREQAELDGCRKVFKNLIEPTTPLGSKFMIISGTGTINGTMYPHNFVDIYEKVETEPGEIAIQMTRTASEIKYEDYILKIKEIESSYFDNMSGPVDAWFLCHPIPIAPQPEMSTADEIFESIFERKSDFMSEEMFEEILVECMPLILNYIDILCQDEYSPQQIAIAFNAVLNKADLEKAAAIQKVTGEGMTKPKRAFNSVTEEAVFLGRQPVQDVEGWCGPSSGFAINSLSNSVAKFGIGKEILRCIHCPFCKQTVDAEVSGGKIRCLSCNATAPWN